MNHSGYVYPWDANATSYTAVARDFVINTNVPYFTSADNFGSDSCLFSPNANAYTPTSRHWSRGIFVVGSTARHPSTSTSPIAAQDVAHWNPSWEGPSSQSKDAQNRGTNLGACISGFAPGQDIYVAKHGDAGASIIVFNENDFSAQTGSSFSSPLVAGLALRKLDQYTYQPYYTGLYDWLMGWDSVSQTATKAPVVAPGHGSYNICYQVSQTPQDPNEWYYLKPGSTCVSGYAQFSMSSPGLTSGAKMITCRP